MADKQHVSMTANVTGESVSIMAVRDVNIYGSVPDEQFEDDPVGECPYPGLSPFDPNQARWFFGRDRELAALRVRLDRAKNDGGPVVVIGASGAGKSSLLRCGLIHSVSTNGYGEAGSRTWPHAVFTPTGAPVAALATALAPLLAAPDDQLVATWRADPSGCADMLRAVLGSRRVLLVVDQFEELFTAAPHTDIVFLDLLDSLCAGAEAPAMIVLGIRADYYGHCLAFPWLATALADDPVQVGPLGPAELEQVLVGPARAVGLSVQPALAQALLADMGATTVPGEDGAGRLPLFAHGLRATWLKRAGRTLTLEGYRDTGGIHGAIATTAERVFGKLTDAEQRAARSVFLRLVRLGTDTEDTRRRIPLADLLAGLSDSAAGHTVINAYTTQRLLTTDQGGVTITHEALLRMWPRLRDWTTQNRAGLVVRQSLSDAAREWMRDERDPSGLYTGSKLDVARAAVEDQTTDLTCVEVEFLNASIRQADTERRFRRRRTIVQRTLAVSLVMLSLIVVGVTVQAAASRAQLAKVSASKLLASLSTNELRLAASDPYDIDLRALAAWQSAPTAEARGALLAAAATPYAGLLPNSGTDPTQAIAASSDGRFVAVGDDDCLKATRPVCGTLRIWDMTSRREVIDQTYAGIVTSLAFTQDGHTLVVGALIHQFQVQVWDMRTLRPSYTLGENASVSVAVSPDGSLVAAYGPSGVTVWRSADQAAIARISTGGVQVWSLAFRGNNLLAAGLDDATIHVWNPATGAPLTVLNKHTKPVHAVAFSPDGNTFASASADGTVLLWNTTSFTRTRVLQPLQGNADNFDSLAFSPDGSVVWAGGSSPNTLGWAAATGEVLDDTPNDGINSVAAIATAPGLVVSGYFNGDVLIQRVSMRVPYSGQETSGAAIDYESGVAAVSDTGGNIDLWNTRTDRSIAVLPTGSPGPPVAFAPKGADLAVGGTGMVTIWDVKTRSPIRQVPLSDQRSSVNDVRYSHDGMFLVAQAIGSKDISITSSVTPTIEVWNTQTWQHLLTISDPSRKILAFAMAPKGSQIAVTNGTDIQLWDLAAPSHRPRRTATWPTGNDTVNGQLAFVPGQGDSMLLAGNVNGTVTEWDTTNHTRQRNFLAAVSAVHALGVSPNGDEVAVSGSDSLISIYSLSDGNLIATLNGDTQAVNSLVFSQDETNLLSTSSDNSVRWWNLVPDHAVRLLCQAVRGPRLAGAWQQLADDAATNLGQPPC